MQGLEIDSVPELSRVLLVMLRLQPGERSLEPAATIGRDARGNLKKAPFDSFSRAGFAFGTMFELLFHGHLVHPEIIIGSSLKPAGVDG